MPQKIIPVKYFYWGMAITALLIVSVFLYLYQKEAAVKKLLKEKGSTTEAWVLTLKEYKTKKKRGTSSSNYYMDIAFFVDTTIASKTVIDTAVNEAKNGPEMVDKLFNKMHAETKPMGNYQTLSIPISQYQFNYYKVNDKVKIVYLKEDPTTAMLANSLE